MKKPSRMDLSMIALGLGANISWKIFEDCIEVMFFKKNGELIEERRVLYLSDNDNVKDLKELGVASGMDLAHCFYLGQKNCKNFMKKVCAYKIGPGKQRYAMSVTFYCKL